MLDPDAPPPPIADDPTELPEGVEVVSAEDDDSHDADQAGAEPTDELLEELHGVAWQAAADALEAGAISEGD